MARRRSLETIEKSKYVTIGELVRLTNVRYSTLKHYTEVKLIPFEQEEENLTRRYSRIVAMERIEHILQLRNENKSIKEISEFYNNNEI